MNKLTFALALAGAGLSASGPVAGSGQGQPFRVGARMPDAAEMLWPGAVHLEGFLGARVAANAANRWRRLRID